MRPVHGCEQIRQAEHAHGRELADGTLMMRASNGLAVEIARGMRARLAGVVGRRVVILAGPGNNGGDALHAGALLADRGAEVRVVTTGSRHHAAGGQALRRAGGSIRPWDDQARALLARADVIVDGILGIGSSGEPREPVATIIAEANRAAAWRVSVDMPTGVDADTGDVGAEAFRADTTVTFASLKPGLLIAPGKEYAGRISVIDIGIDDALGPPVARTIDAADADRLCRPAQFADYKYRRGVTGIAAGSAQYPGAGLLCAAAALAGPTGMTVLLDRGDGVAGEVVRQHPEVVRTDRLPHERVTAWACGPGFAGTDEDHATVAAILGAPLPVVLDAGALTVLAQAADLRAMLHARSAPTVITPHEGEFARLGGAIGPDRLAGASALSARLNAVVVRKGPGTIVSAPDGTCLIDRAGTPALATAGSGDVLTGCIASLLAAAQARGALIADADVAEAVAAACWLHGMAGRAAQSRGTATASAIARALHRVQGAHPSRGQSRHGPR